jgi:hypothetical protein
MQKMETRSGKTNQLDECDTFIDKGMQARGPEGHKRINFHLVFDCKQDLRHKARFVAGGHMTAPPRDSLYSGVVSLRSMRFVALLAELNGLEMQAADVGLGIELVTLLLSTRHCMD